VSVATALCQRTHLRVAGPFDGRRVGALETPIQLFDLSAGGAFVNSMYEQKNGVKLLLKIDLPVEGWITVKAETLYTRPGGFAIRFVDMPADVAIRLDRALRALQECVLF
jgi:hypothetical protein